MANVYLGQYWTGDSTWIKVYFRYSSLSWSGGSYTVNSPSIYMYSGAEFQTTNRVVLYNSSGGAIGWFSEGESGWAREYAFDGSSFNVESSSNSISVSASFYYVAPYVDPWSSESTKFNYQTLTGTIDGSGCDKTSPTVSASVTATSSTTISISASSNVSCNSWDYKIGNGSWQNFSTTDGTTASTTVTVTSNTHIVYVRARKTSNYVYGSTSGVSVDTTLPTVTLSISDNQVGTNSVSFSASSNVNCNVWEYSTNNGYTWSPPFSTTNTTSVSGTISGLVVNTSYDFKVRAKKTSNGLYGTSSTITKKTLGNTIINSMSTCYPDSPGAVTITMNQTQYVASYVHKMLIKNGNETLITFNNIRGTTGTTNKILNISSQNKAILLSAIPITSKTQTLTAELYTYESYTGSTYGTQIGSASSVNFIVSTTQENSGPTLSATVVDMNDVSYALTQDRSKIVTNLSTARCTMNATARNGATLETTTINGVSTTATDFVKTTATSFVFVVIDSRGYSVSQTVSPNVVRYIEPTLIIPSIQRKIPVSSNKIYLKFSGNFYNGAFRSGYNNELTIKYRFKESPSGSYGDYITLTPITDYVVTSTGFNSVDNLELSSNLDYTKVYDFEICVVDRVNTVLAILAVSRGTPVFDWGNDDFRFNVPVQMVDDLSVNGDITSSGNISATGSITSGGTAVSLSGHTHTKSSITDFAHTHTKSNITDFAHTHTKSDITDFSDIVNLIYPVGSIYMSINSTSPATLFGGEWERIENKFLLSASATYGAGTTGGEVAHKLTLNELPKVDSKLEINTATHATWDGNSTILYYKAGGTYGGLSGDGLAYGQFGVHFGNDEEHNNMPPYLAVYMWKRTA